MDNGTEQSIAKLVMVNSEIKRTNATRDGISISSPDGDLIIQNLRYEDAGVYQCRFPGSGNRYITLLVTGELVPYCFMVYG